MAVENPKYYSGIRVVEKREEEVQPNHGHWHYAHNLLSGRIMGRFTTLQPLHVGTGQFVPPERLGLVDAAPLVKSFYRAAETITVPGSSLKGAIRSLVEMITYSAVSKTRVRLDRKRFGESQYNAKRQSGSLDIAGKLFGAMGYLGHIHVEDAPLITEAELQVQDIPPQYQPAPDANLRRYYPHYLQDERRPLWPLEIVAAGEQFAFTIHFENLEEAELGLLVIALGQTDPPLCLKLGAGKSSGMGAIRFEIAEAHFMKPATTYIAYEADWAVVDIPAAVRAAMSLVRADGALSRLHADLGCESL